MSSDKNTIYEGPNLDSASSNTYTGPRRITSEVHDKGVKVQFHADDGLVNIGNVPVTRAQYEELTGQPAPKPRLGEGRPQVRLDQNMLNPVVEPARQEQTTLETADERPTSEDVTTDLIMGTAVLEAELGLGWSPDAVAEFAEDVSKGTLAPDDPIWKEMAQKAGIQREHIEGMRDNVRRAQQTIAKRELGDAGYARLQALASASPKVNGMLTHFAVKRATGKEKVAYSKILGMAEMLIKG